jgi:hypothetical protein
MNQPVPELLHVLLLGDSLSFHGPVRGELLTNPALMPNVLGRELTERLGRPVEVDVVARLGFTARDAWWAMTKDPMIYSVLMPRASAVILEVGLVDGLPASIPTYLRMGIDHMRSDRIRHRVAKAYHLAHPWLVHATNARMRVLPLRATVAYLRRCINGIRYFHPDLPIVATAPPKHSSKYFPMADRGHVASVEAARRLGVEFGIPIVELEPLVRPHHDAGRCNPDGLHWGWEAHVDVAHAYADVLVPLLRGSAPPAP